MKKVRYILVLLISFGLIVSLMPINAIDFEVEEEVWKGICSQSSISKDNIENCRQYADFLQDRVKDSQDVANKYKGEINKYKNDIAKQIEIAKGFERKIDEINAEIITLNNNITTLENNIVKIEADIEARKADIAEKDRIIIERMRKTQSDMRFGHEIDFLIKAKDFSTLLASASVVNDILDFESVQIKEINRLIAKQKEDQAAIELQKETVKLNIISAKNKKADVVVLKSEVEVAIKNYQESVMELAALQSQATADANAVKKQMDKINKALAAVETSKNFVRPIAGGRISARVWAYPAPWSAMHLGYDYAAPVGTPIRAGANGVVLASYDACPTTGRLGNWCGRPGMGGGGNQVFLIVSVEDKIYGLTYFHMQSGTPIASGQTVAAGQIIGRMGSSGNSTGPHVHVEVLYLGNQTIQEYISNWNGRLDHSVGMNLSNRCHLNGYRSPCRMDPALAFGYD